MAEIIVGNVEQTGM